jgi:hypothetical protein
MTASLIMSARIRSGPSARAATGSLRSSPAREFQWVLSGRNRAALGKAVSFAFFKDERRVGIYYFYILDPDFGPGFIKICTYAPWPAKVWLNGHEWGKRQAIKAGVAFTALSNGFQSTAEPERLQAICDSFGPHHAPTTGSCRAGPRGCCTSIRLRCTPAGPHRPARPSPSSANPHEPDRQSPELRPAARERGRARQLAFAYSPLTMSNICCEVWPKPGQHRGPPGALIPISRWGASEIPTAPQPTSAIGWPALT